MEEDSNVTTSVIRRRKQQSPADSDLDDFELISGDELDEVSPWKGFDEFLMNWGYPGFWFTYFQTCLLEKTQIYRIYKGSH